MTKTHRRKLKNVIATTIAYTLIMIAIFIIGLIVIKVASLIVVHLTYEQFRQAMIVISFIGTVTAVIILLRKNERSERDE